MAVLRKVTSGILKGIGLVSAPHAPAAPMGTVTRDDAIAQTQMDEMLRRKGGAADILSGIGGAEPQSGIGKSTLGA